jgi:hypothetical protein
MLKIIKERTPEVIIDRYIEFTYKDDPDAGFVFPATVHGDPDFDSMCSEALANYDKCLTNKDRFTEPEFKVEKYTYTHPAIGQCSCSRYLTLECDYEGAVMCECGKWYNLFGQELRDPKYWEEDYE